jgi:hypothetical protein
LRGIAAASRDADDPVDELRRLQDLNRELLSVASGPQALSAVLWYLLTVNDADPTALEVVLEQPLGSPGTEALPSKVAKRVAKKVTLTSSSSC